MSRSRDAALERALLVLTFTAGLVDAVSFLGLGSVFVANMTGNIVLMGFGLAGAEGFAIAAPLVSLGAFIAGAVIGGRIGVRLHDRRMRWLAGALVAETSFILLAAILSIGVDVPADDWRRYAMIALLAAALGARNASIRGLKVPDLKTTVVTFTITGLAVESPLGGREAQHVATRTLAVASILAGAFLGALLVLNTELVVPLLVVAALNTATLLAVRDFMEDDEAQAPGGAAR